MLILKVTGFKKIKMNNVKVIGNIDLSETLWRFMSLDKFIDLLETRSLFFSSLNNFNQTDPYEGYLPKNYNNRMLAQVEQYAESLLGQSGVSEIRKYYPFGFNFFKTPAINCWHENNFESDAMWRLYSDQGKGVAIKTTAERLIKSVLDTSEKVNYGKVTYLDFESEEDENQKVSDIMPGLYKRFSFHHERERRLFIYNNPFESVSKKIPLESQDILNLMSGGIEFKNNKIKVDLDTLIHEVIVSPFVNEPFGSSVKAICNKYGFKDKVVFSKLLNQYELFNF